MSASGLHKATNLSVVKRREADFYATPAQVTQAFLAAEASSLSRFHTIWEPAAGAGAMAAEIRTAGFNVVCSDAVDRGCDAAVVNFYDASRMARAIVTNPPFADCSGKMPWMWQAHRLAVEYMVLLLPAGWPYAEGRRSFLNAWPIAREWKVGWRIDWTGGGASPANHSWYVWSCDAPRSQCWSVGVLYRGSIESQPSLFAEASS